MKEITLYDTVAPGSETWNWNEEENNSNSANTLIAFNVTKPVLTVYDPSPEKRNGSAIIICPGGGFHFLAIEHEGSDAAKWFAAQGVTAFVLKYRLVPVETKNPFDDESDDVHRNTRDRKATEVIPLAIADGRQALAYVRRHAEDLGLSADKIGILGFSAGGLVAIATAFNSTNENQPDFVVGAYPEVRNFFLKSPSADSPSLYLTCAQDDQFGFVRHTLDLYKQWLDAGASVEMHLFSRGGHGFGTGNSQDSTNNWLFQCYQWMISEGFATPVSF